VSSGTPSGAASSGTPSGAASVVTAPLWRRLFDDAAVFPPGNAAFADAVPAYARRSTTDLGEYVGPFIAPATRWDEFRQVLPDRPIEVSAIVSLATLPGLLEAVAAEARVVLRCVEIPTLGAPGVGPSGVADTVAALEERLPTGVIAYLEVPLGAGFADAAATVRAAGHRIKVRTGGTTAEAFPSVVDLADALATCVRLALPAKLTAGLHNALRHTDHHTGFHHHGFLNVVAAVSAALDEPDPRSLAQVLGDTDPGRVAARVAAIPMPRMAKVREVFTSFGTCGIDEPYADLAALGLVPPRNVVPASGVVTASGVEPTVPGSGLAAAEEQA
jgi:hypothetical protein